MAHKIGFRTAGFHQIPLEQCLIALAEIGYDGVEICLEHPDSRPESLTPTRCESIAKRAAELGLDIASVSYHADGEDEEARARNQLRAIDITAHFGADILIINAQRSIEGQERDQLDAFGDLLADALLPRAEAAGISLACEPEPGMFVDGSAEMLYLLELLHHPRLGVNLDIGHAFLTDDSLPEAIAVLDRRILHVHFEDMPAGVHQHLVPGDGDMNLPEVIAALDCAGFAGYYTIDLFNIADAPVDWARRACAATKRLLQT